MIAIQDLHKSFDRQEVLHGITLTCATGRVTGIVGPNSCGKSTVVKSILGLVLPEKGDIRIDGEPLRAEGRYRADLGYMSQTTSFPENMRVREIFSLLEDLRGKGAPREESMISRLALGGVLLKPFGALSGGARQRVGAVAALMFDPQTLILDEPTASLDPLAAIHMREVLMEERAAGKTLLLVSHVLSEIEQLARDVVLMNDGRIVHSGPLESLREGGASLEAGILEQFRRHGAAS